MFAHCETKHRPSLGAWPGPLQRLSLLKGFARAGLQLGRRGIGWLGQALAVGGGRFSMIFWQAPRGKFRILKTDTNHQQVVHGIKGLEAGVQFRETNVWESGKTHICIATVYTAMFYIVLIAI